MATLDAVERDVSPHRSWHVFGSRNYRNHRSGVDLKNTEMPSSLRLGSSVSSRKSKYCKFIDPPPGGKGRVKETVNGVIVQSLPEQKWMVKLARGESEVMISNNLKNIEAPSAFTFAMVRECNKKS